MPHNLSCPNCGAPLDYAGGSASTIRCPFCNNSVIVPAELRDHAAPSEGTVALQPGALKDIADLARGGEKIEAIKRYRAMYGVGLKQARAAVDALASGEPVQIRSARPVTAVAPAGPDTSNLLRWIGCGIAAFVAFTVVVSILPAIMVPIAMFFAFNSGPSGPPAAVPAPPALATSVGAPTSVPRRAATPGTSAVMKFGGQGTGPGLFTNAHSIALDGAGHIYVGDFKGGRVQVFDSSGKYSTQWSAGNSKTLISALAADRKGTTYVVADGEIKRVEGATGRPLGSLQYPDGNRFDSIAVTADGGLVATWFEAQFGIITSTEGHRDDLVRFDSDGQVSRVVRGFISDQTGEAEIETRIAVDGLGTVYALGGAIDHSVFKFTPEGKYVNKFGGTGNAPGQFTSPSAIAVDNQSRVYVADRSGGIQVFDPNGRYLDAFPLDDTLSAMIFDDKNNLFGVTGTQVVEYVLKR